MYVCMYVCIQSFTGWDFLDSGNAIKREPRSVTPKRKKNQNQNKEELWWFQSCNSMKNCIAAISYSKFHAVTYQDKIS